MLQFSYDDLLTMISELNTVDQIIANDIAQRMQTSLDTFQQAVQVETPVGVSGAARGGIMTYLEGVPLDLTGVVTIAVLYGEPLEYGRLPGRMPPPSALELWVVRKWGLSGDQAVQASWALARHIAARGTRGAFMFEKGFNNASPYVSQIWEDMPGAIVEQI